MVQFGIFLCALRLYAVVSDSGVYNVARGAAGEGKPVPPHASRCYACL